MHNLQTCNVPFAVRVGSVDHPRCRQPAILQPKVDRCRAMSRPLNSHLDFAPLRFSTCGLPERERLARWREEFGRSLLRVDIEPLSGRPFRPQATLRLLPELRTIEATGSAAHFRCAGALAVDPDDFISVIIGEHGIASQRGREAVLSAGDAIAVLHQEPGDITFPEGSFFAVLAPRTALASRVSDIEDAAMRPIPRGTEPLRLLVSYIRAVRNLTLASSEMRRLAVNHVHYLMAMALSSDRATRARFERVGSGTTRRNPRTNRHAVPGTGTQRGSGGEESSDIATLSAPSVGNIRHVVYRARERVAPATRLLVVG